MKGTPVPQWETTQEDENENQYQSMAVEESIQAIRLEEQERMESYGD